MATVHAGRNRPTDFLITNRRRDEANRNQMKERTNYYAQTRLQSEFEESSGTAIRRNHLFKRYEELKTQEEATLEERRARLRALLAEDEELYRQELLAKEETKESRLAAMKLRMQELKTKRETERKMVVDEKLRQRWRNECDELRQIESQVLELEVADARAEQVAELEERKRYAAEEKKYFDYLWEQDRQRKIQREETERQKRKQQDEAAVTMLKEQMESLRLQAIEEDRLKREEAALMRQEYETRQLEEERNRLRKQQEQRQIQLELDNFNKLKVRQKLEEAQEAVNMDVKIVDQFFRMDERDREFKSRKKEEMRKEMQLYRENLMTQKQEQEAVQREIERMHKDEEEKVWQTRAEKWQREQRARDRLMKEVLECRKEQLKNAVEINRRKQEQTKLDRERILHQLEVAKRAEEIAQEKHRQAMKQYTSALMEQMREVRVQRQDERKQLEMEAAVDRDAEEKFRELLRREAEYAQNIPRARAFVALNPPS